MPLMDGVELALSLRRDGWKKGLFWLMNGHAAAFKAEPPSNLHIARIIEKSFDPVELSAWIGEALQDPVPCQ